MFRKSSQKHLFAVCISVVVFTCVIGSSAAAPQPDIEGKLVLANLDRYDVVLQFGKIRRPIKPQKALPSSPMKIGK